MQDISWVNIDEDIDKYVDIDNITRKYMPYHIYEMNKLRDALQFMKKPQDEKNRADKKKGSSHPEKVVKILLHFGVIHPIALQGAAFHDLAEDVDIKYLPLIKGAFGEDVACVVDLLTRKHKDGEIIPVSDGAMIALETIWSVLIRLADRIHNFRNRIRRIDYQDNFFSLEKLRKISRETKEYIIPMGEKAQKLYPDYKYVIQSMLNELENELKEARRAIRRERGKKIRNKVKDSIFRAS